MILLSALAGFFAVSVIGFLAVEIRKRTVQTNNASPETPPVNTATTGAPLPKRARGGGRSPIYVAFLVAATGGLLIYNRYKSGGGQAAPGKYDRSCTGPPAAEERLKIMSNLYGFHYEISTTSSQAQALFNQGLLFAWNFNQPEALKCFKLAANLDPKSSMPSWGMQYAIGPGANRETTPQEYERDLCRAAVSQHKEYPAFTPDQFTTVQQAAQTSLKLAQQALASQPAGKAQRRELAFAKAASIRWPDGSQFGTSRDRAELEYGQRMQAFGESEQDAGALAMAAEAMMNLNPWEYYLPNGSMKPSAQKAEQLIKAALVLDPQSPLANHLLMHISEASSTLRSAPLSAARAEASANRLHFSKGPWVAHQGHLLHMPSHTFIRIGRYHDAAVSNVKAFNADLKLAQHCMEPYEPEHNTDMLIYTSSMSGEVKQSLEFATSIKDFGSLMFYKGEFSNSHNWVKYPLVLVHFGRWADVFKLAAPGPGDRGNCPAGGADFAQTVWRFARVMALAARAEGAKLSDDVSEYAKMNSYLDKYVQQLEAASRHVVSEEQTNPPAVYMCEHRGLADIYELLANARVSYLRGDIETAIAKLGEAVKIEDGFLYMEPPRVYQPVRQCLGFVLLQGNLFKEAEKVYREDLVQYPENGWSLHGLSAALHAQSNFGEVSAIRSRLETAWSHAQESIDSSCLAFSKPWGEPK